MSELGLALPATREGFRGMMDSIDLTTTAGQEMFAALLGTAEQADDYYRCNHCAQRYQPNKFGVFCFMTKTSHRPQSPDAT